MNSDLPKPSPKPSDAELWQHWLNRLSPETRRCLTSGPSKAPIVTEEKANYLAFLDSLSPEARAAMESLRHEESVVGGEVEPDPRKFCYLLVEVHDGEHARLVAFTSPEKLARHLGTLEGEDVDALVFYGMSLPFTRGPQRYLFLEDGESALQIPRYKGCAIRKAPADLVHNEVQEDHFLGPPELGPNGLPSNEMPPNKDYKGHPE